MIVRLLVQNLFSFGELTEFNMLPGRSNRLSNHVLKAGNLELLKLNAIYGANGAGKSKLIQALELLKNFVITGTLPAGFITETFKFVEDSRSQDVYLGVEFIKNEIPFFYGLTINQGIIIEEELLISGLDKKEDKVLFRRTDKVAEEALDIFFHDDILSNAEAALFPSFLKTELLQRNQPVLFYMKNRQSPVFNSCRIAAEWFERDLVIILPNSKQSTTGLLFSSKIIFDFAIETMRSFNTGIDNIEVETVPAEEYFGQDDKRLIDVFTSQLKATSRRWKIIDENRIDSVFTIENDKPVVKKVIFYHKEDEGKVKFELSQESDGTKRLFDYIPVLFSLLYFDTVFFIDEIERSIHPLLIKELIKKFSLDPKTKGQLIFSTHESNLLDQELFRPDEIWFAEKNKQGATELFPLSEFKEHHTIDIRKGYLTGRYGAIPFLSNLKDLNWDKYAETN
jgi:AAA15 family ATPase/GTPase